MFRNWAHRKSVEKTSSTTRTYDIQIVSQYGIRYCGLEMALRKMTAFFPCWQWRFRRQLFWWWSRRTSPFPAGSRRWIGTWIRPERASGQPDFPASSVRILSVYISITLDPACHFDADPDPTFHFDGVPDLSLQIKAQKKCSNRLIFHTFWLVICKFMRIRFGIQLFTLMQMRIRMRIQVTNIVADPNPDPRVFWASWIRIRIH